MAGNIIGDIWVVCGDGISTYSYAWVDGNDNRIPGNGFTSRSSQQGTYKATNCEHFYIEVVNLLTGYDRWEVDLDGLEFNSNTQVTWGYSGAGRINVRCTSSRGGTLTINGVKQSSPTYTLHFNANDGINPPADMEGNSNNNYTVTIPNSTPTREGYTFVEWNTHPLGSGTAFRRKDPVHLDVWGNLTLYAQWEKNPITGSIECIERTTTSLTFEWKFTPSMSGYIELTNTKTGNEADSREVSGDDGSVTFNGLSSGIRYEANLYYYDGRVATWINSATGTTKSNYTMSYDSNIPSGAVGSVTDDPPASESFESDTYVTVSSTTLTFREASGYPKYRFKEWNTKKDGTGTGYSGGETFQIISNITLYAIWVRQCYIQFYGNCNDAVDNIPYNGNKMWYDVGAYFTISETEPTRGAGDEWSFLHWEMHWESARIGTCSAGDPISLTESVDLYAQWKQNAKLAKPTVTKSSKDGASITVSVDKNDGYGGYWEVTAWIDGKYSSTHQYGDEGSPFNITFRNLSPSTLYKIKAVHCVNGVGKKESETIFIRTNIPTFNWTGSNENDAIYITKGKDLSGTEEASPLKAEKWNELTKLIQTCQTINLGGITDFTSAAKGAEITAQIFNEVAYALGDLNDGVMPAKGEPVKMGEDILASYFAGYGSSLKETINGISEEINRKT